MEMHSLGRQVHDNHDHHAKATAYDHDHDSDRGRLRVRVGRRRLHEIQVLPKRRLQVFRADPRRIRKLQRCVRQLNCVGPREKVAGHVVVQGNHGTGALPPAEEGNAAGTSLFCFTVATSQGVTGPGVKPGYEQHLLNLFKSRKVGLCACDAWTTYEGARVSMGSWQAVVNADMFIKVWKQVEKEQTYKAHDWTVKVDSDAVFLPDRLKQHIQALRPPKDAPVYLRNIDFKWKFQGALEVLSKMAVEVYLQNADICRHHLSHNRGEDSYMKACLEAIWVGHMEDFTLLNDKATHPKGWNIFDVDDCTNPSVVALHPYRAANSWWACYEVATGLKKTSDFVGCGHRWPGDACSMTSKRVHEDASSGLAEPRSLTLAWPSQLRRKL